MSGIKTGSSGIGSSSVCPGTLGNQSTDNSMNSNNQGQEANPIKAHPQVYDEFKNEKNKDDNMMAEKGEQKREPQHWQTNYI
jgi:hypothetical protein